MLLDAEKIGDRTSFCPLTCQRWLTVLEDMALGYANYMFKNINFSQVFVTFYGRCTAGASQCSTLCCDQSVQKRFKIVELIAAGDKYLGTRPACGLLRGSWWASVRNRKLDLANGTVVPKLTLATLPLQPSRLSQTPPSWILQNLMRSKMTVPNLANFMRYK